jgi:hypothetical protein
VPFFIYKEYMENPFSSNGAAAWFIFMPKDSSNHPFLWYGTNCYYDFILEKEKYYGFFRGNNKGYQQTNIL